MEDDRIANYADKIYTALTGKKKEETILEVILETTIDQRLEICNKYLTVYNRDLYADIKAKLSGQFKEQQFTFSYLQQNSWQKC